MRSHQSEPALSLETLIISSTLLETYVLYHWTPSGDTTHDEMNPSRKNTTVHFGLLRLLFGDVLTLDRHVVKLELARDFSKIVSSYQNSS